MCGSSNIYGSPRKTLRSHEPIHASPGLAGCGDGVAAARGAPRGRVRRGVWRARPLRRGADGRLTVAALPSMAAVPLVAAVARFARTNPDVEVAILDALSGSVLDAVAEGRADAGLTVRPAPRATLTYKSLLSDEFGLVCRPDDSLAGDDSLPWMPF